MLSLPPCAARLACGVLIMLLLVSPMLWGQETQPPESAPSTEASKPSPSDAQPAPEPAARKSRARTAETNINFDFARLAHPSVADQLELTDEQRAEVARIITQRATQLASVPQAERQAILNKTNQELAALLDPDQLAKLSDLAGEQKLKFNFREQKWADVLDWFARQAGLELVMDKLPPGDFTFTNNRSYSPREAIDLLNSVLLTKGFSLLQRGRMLILVDLDDDLSSNLIPRVRPEDIGEHGDFEIISVWFPLAGRPADKVVQEIQPLIGKYGSCVGLPQTGQLKVTETAGMMQAISIVIASIPVPKPPEKERPPEKKPDPPPPVLAVYSLEEVKPEAALEILNALFSSAKFTVDDNQLLAYARPSEQEAIKASVDKMVENRPPGKKPRLEVYSIDLPNAEELVEQLEAALPEIHANMDTAMSRLVVFAAPQDQDLVKEMLQKMGADDSAAARQVVVYQTRHFDPAALTTLIEQLAPRAAVATDAQLRRVIVTAGPAEQVLIKSLVDQLDQESALEDQPLLQIYPLDKPVDATLVTTLQGIIPRATVALSTDGRRLSVVARVVDQTVVKKMVEQWTQAASAQEEPELKFYALDTPLASTDLATISTLVPDAQATLSTDGRQLKVIARSADQATVESLIQRLTEAATAQEEPELKFYALNTPLASTDLTMISTLVPDAQATLSTDGRQLKVIARSADQAAVESLIQRLTEASTAQPKPLLKVYPLEHVLTEADVAHLTRLIPGAQITRATDGRQLRVMALADEHAELEELIQQFETAAASEVQPELALIPLNQPLDATVLASLQAVVPQAKLTPSTDQTELFVVARGDELAIIRKMLEQLKVTGDATEKRLLIGYAINSGSPQTVLEMLQTVFPGVKFSADEKSRRILAYASLSEQGRIKQTVAQLDVEGAPDTLEEVRSYSTGDVNPTPVVTMLQQLVPDMQLTPDTSGRRLLARGTVRDHETLEKALEQVRSGDATRQPVIKAYPMPGREVRSLLYMRSVLLELIPEAAITIDGRGGSIVVAATEQDHAKLKQAIDEILKLDSSDSFQLEVYTLDKLPASQVTRALGPVVPDAEITVGDDPRQIVVWASTTDHQRVVAALAKLEEAAGTDGGRVLQLHRVRPAVVAQVGSFIARTLPNMQVLTGQGTDRVLVWGTPQDQQRLAALIGQMDQELGLDTEREMKTYDLGEVSATEARRVLDSAIGNLEYVAGNKEDQLVVWAGTADHAEVARLLEELKQAVATPQQVVKVHRFDVDEMDVTTLYNALTPEDIKDLAIQVNTVTNSLVVRGPAERQAALEETLATLVEQLPVAEKPTAVVYRLERADPTAARLLLSSLLPAVPVAVDITNRTLAVTATAKDHAQIKEVLSQLDDTSGGELIMETYVMKRGNPTAVMAAIKAIIPQATVSSDIYNKLLIVAATEEQQKQIKAIIERADGEGEGVLTTKAYPLKYANSLTISTALANVVPAATVSADTLNKMLIVTATDDDHQRIQAVLDQADKRGVGELVTKAYVLQLANPSTIAVALSSVVPNATISPDTVNKMLIVTASEEDQQRVQAIVDEADRRSEGEVTTTVYALKFANPLALSYSIKPIAPNATASPDIYNKTLIVAATAKDHERIKAVIDQADKRGGGDLLTKAYNVKWANATTIATALSTVVPDATISSDVTNKMLIVTANQDDHTKIQEVLEQADRRGGGEQETKAYSLRTANPSTIMLALRSVVPDATVGADTVNRLLIVTASAEDHLRVQSIVDTADRRNEGELVTEAYLLKWANPQTLALALEPVVPNATLTADPTNQTLVVTATTTDQQLVKKVIDQTDRRGDGEMTTEVYLLTRANPLYLQRALAALVPEAEFGADSVNKMLIVTAPEEEQEKIKKIIERADRRGDGEVVTKVYAFKLADPGTAATALQTLLPNAQMSADEATSTLIVTGTSEDHQQVDALVKELDVASPSTRVLKPYVVQNADPAEVYSALNQLFRYDRDINVGYQEETGMILVFAPTVDQEEVGRAIMEIEKATAERPQATLEVYQLEGLDGDAALDTLTALLKDETPRIELQVDDTNNQILAIADPRQQELIKKALARLEPVERDVEVFLLERLDPYTAQSAINTLFTDLPYAAMPSVEADADNQQLIVHATKAQLERIRLLLEKMGEGGAGQRGRSANSMLRIIPLSGDTDSLLREIERIWPQLRANPMQIVTPPQRNGGSPQPPSPPPSRTPREEGDAGEPNTRTGEPGRPAGDGASSAEQEAAALVPAVFVSALNPEDPPESPSQAAAPRESATTAPPDPADVATVPPGDPGLPPIVIIAGDKQLTVASRDIEAVNQFEELLKTLQHGRRVSFSNGNFSMFLLQNADAKELAEVLNNLFRRDSRSSRGGYGSYGSYGSYGQRRSTSLTVVADERMNALLAYGSTADRAVVEEMLEVLDSSDIPDSLTSEKPRMIPVKNLPAGTVLTVLQSVYKSQLSARRGLRPVTIPVGISGEMTSMLELINATANSPILTLDVDETTNSIVMRAPRQLGEEIETFISDLDEQAKDGGTRSISLVPLQGMNSEQIQDALQLLMRGGRYRGGSSSYRSRQ